MDLRALAMGLAFAIMWSSAFTSTRMIVTVAPPLTALAIRFLLSGMIGIALARAMGQSWHLTRPQWRATIIFGLCQNAIYLGCNWIAMQWVEAGLASIIAATMPLMVAGIGWFAFGERLRPMGLVGLAVGLIGVTIIMSGRLNGGSSGIGIALCFAGALALAIATLTVRGASTGGNVLMIVGIQMLIGSAVLSVAAALFEPFRVTWSPRLIWAFIYTLLIPGLAATFVWFKLVGRIGAVRAAAFHFLTPFFGVGIGALLLGERLGTFDIVGVAVIMAGILAVQLSKQPPAAVPASTKSS